MKERIADRLMIVHRAPGNLLGQFLRFPGTALRIDVLVGV